MRSKVAVVIVGAILAVAFGVAGRGQEPLRQDVLNTLLVEVRALRAAIEQMASASALVQLAMGRLQIQEQRVNTLLRRLDELRQSLATLERQTAGREAELVRLEELLPRTAELGERQAIAERVRDLASSAESVGSWLKQEEFWSLGSFDKERR